MDSSIHLTAQKSIDATITIEAYLVSGNPENYPISLHFSDLPTGISLTEDSFSFRLNWLDETTMKVQTDTGNYVFNINITTPQGSSKYPVNVHVDP